MYIYIYKGRTHWNIPKHLARFQFKLDPQTGTTLVNVYPMLSYTFSKPNIQDQENDQELPKFQPIYDTKACFSTKIYTCPILSNLQLPISLNALPFVSTTMVQPPLQEGDVHLGAVSTQSWKSVEIDMSGHVNVVHIKASLETLNHEDDVNKKKFRFGDGIGFPDFRPYRIGFHWSDLTLKFPAASILSAT